MEEPKKVPKKEIEIIIDAFDKSAFLKMQDEFKALEGDFDIFLCYSKRGKKLIGLRFTSNNVDSQKKIAAEDMERALNELSDEV